MKKRFGAQPPTGYGHGGGSSESDLRWRKGELSEPSLRRRRGRAHRRPSSNEQGKGGGSSEPSLR
eukprot:10843036-Karenia_brevis.AAC.1